MSQAKTVAADALGTGRELLGNNKKTAWILGTGLAIANWAGWINVGLPNWWPIGAVALGAAYLIGKEAAKRIDELLPEEQGILVIAFQADDLGGGEIYELSEDAYDDMTVEGGEVFEWPETARRVVEVSEYDPETNTAVGNWRESKPGSALAEPPTVDDVLAAIRELRMDLKPDVAEARELRRRIRGIVRALDRQRAEAQQRALDEHVAPDVEEEGMTISEVIEDELPDDLHPKDWSDETSNAEDLAESVDPDPDAEGSQQPAATDGGQPDE